MDENRQEAIDWLDGTIEELTADLLRLQGLRRRVAEGAALYRSDLDDIEAVAHGLELDVMAFKRRLVDRVAAGCVEAHAHGDGSRSREAPPDPAE